MLTCGQSAQWDLPFVIDAEGDQITSVSAKLSKSWLKFDSSLLTFTFDGPAVKEDSAGQLIVPITLTDQFGATTTVKQIIIVIFIPTEEPATEDTKASSAEPVAGDKNQTSIDGPESNPKDPSQETY